jgi:hypothetical protein
MFEVGRDRSGVCIFPPLAMLFFLVCLSRGSILCLRHRGITAPILLWEKPLGFGVGQA